MPQMITIGETMAAFSPDSIGALRYVNTYHLRTAGAESNVAIGAAKLGIDVEWVSRVGEDEFGHFICNQNRAEGVGCHYLIFDRFHRTGLMFKETGIGETRVFYYREGSAASHMNPEDLNEELFRRSQLLHMTGITPVLSDSCKEATLSAFSLAKKYDLKISFDPNIRKKLWKDHDYRPLIRELTLQSHIVLLGLDEAEILFDTKEPEAILSTIFSFGTAEYAAIKDGSNGAIVSDGKNTFSLAPYPCRCIEPIGAGDGFNAGFLAGILTGKGLETAGRMGCICGALATQTPGDVEGYPDQLQMEQALNGHPIVFR